MQVQSAQDPVHAGESDLVPNVAGHIAKQMDGQIEFVRCTEVAVANDMRHGGLERQAENMQQFQAVTRPVDHRWRDVLPLQFARCPGQGPAISCLRPDRVPQC